MKHLMMAIVLAVCGVACGTTQQKTEAESGEAADEALNPDTSQSRPAIEIAGTWTSNFGGEETITDGSWGTAFGTATIVSYDNDENVAILQSPADDTFNPSKFNRVVWTEIVNDSFYYCWVVFGQDTADAAENDTTTADATDPENSGCGGFAWTKLSRSS